MAGEMKQVKLSTQGKPSTKALGDVAEMRALRYLQDQAMTLVERNYRTPGRGGGEIDLIMRDAQGTLVFVEVRARSRSAHGGALASITVAKQRRIIWAARHYLTRLSPWPPCRFDVVALESDGQLQWIRAAFDASA
jgi:putative endonuclease